MDSLTSAQSLLIRVGCQTRLSRKCLFSKLRTQRTREFSRSFYTQSGQYKLPVSGGSRFSVKGWAKWSCDPDGDTGDGRMVDWTRQVNHIVEARPVVYWPCFISVQEEEEYS